MKLFVSKLFLPRLWLMICIALVCIPIAVIVAALGEFDAEIWTFLLEFQLPLLLKNTFFLILGVGIGTAFLGTSCAWLTAMYDFPLRRFFFWAAVHRWISPIQPPIVFVTEISFFSLFPGIFWVIRSRGFFRCWSSCASSAR